jgi:hypothetical protein
LDGRLRGVLFGVLKRGIRRDLGGDVVTDALDDPISVTEQGSEVLVERLQNVAQSIQFRFVLEAAAIHGRGGDFGFGVRKGQAEDGFLLHPVTVHVDGFENTFGEVGLGGRG